MKRPKQVKFEKWQMGKTPEETLSNTIAAMGIDAEEFAVRALLPITRTSQVIAGVAPVTVQMEIGFGRVVRQHWPWGGVKWDWDD